MTQLDYIRDPQEIYRQSFAAIRQQANLSALPQDLHPLAIRLIHACGMVDVIEDLKFSDGAVHAGKMALQQGACIFSDVEMVRAGIIASCLPANNKCICTLNDARTRELADQIDTTRSAAGVDLWGDGLAGSVVVIGNAPTALFRLLERLDEGCCKPALIIGLPVGFVGAVEAKQELAGNPRGCAFITLKGRRGGSALASSALNALAGGCDG